MKKIQTITSLIALTAVMGTPFLALANDGGRGEGSSNVKASIEHSGFGARILSQFKANFDHDKKSDNDNKSARKAWLGDRGATMIDARIASLTKLQTRVNALTHLTTAQKATFSANVSAEIAALTDLKAKIAAGTDPVIIKADLEAVTKAYRTHWLVMPQAQVAVAADRALGLVDQMKLLSGKLQTRITEASAAGTDVTAAQSAYTDMQAKLADATADAQAAISLVATLQADNGNATVFAANQAAFKDARTQLKAARAGLMAARADVRTILSVVTRKDDFKADKHDFKKDSR